MAKIYRTKNPRIRTLHSARLRVKEYIDEGYAAKFEKIQLKNGGKAYKVVAKKMLKVGDRNISLYGKAL
jgi:hypothetical protein